MECKFIFHLLCIIVGAISLPGNTGAFPTNLLCQQRTAPIFEKGESLKSTDTSAIVLVNSYGGESKYYFKKGHSNCIRIDQSQSIVGICGIPKHVTVTFYEGDGCTGNNFECPGNYCQPNVDKETAFPYYPKSFIINGHIL